MKPEFALLITTLLLAGISLLLMLWNSRLTIRTELDFFWHMLHNKVVRLWEGLHSCLGRLLPDWLVDQALLRAITHGTTGRYDSTDVHEVRAITIWKRWGHSNE